MIRQHPNSKNTYDTHHYWSLSIYLPSFTNGIFLGKHQTIKKRHLSDIQPLTIHRDAMLNHDPWPWTWKFIFICWKPPTTQFHCVKVRAIPCCIRVISDISPKHPAPQEDTPWMLSSWETCQHCQQKLGEKVREFGSQGVEAPKQGAFYR